MKISEFIDKYLNCPICGSELDCMMRIHLMHTLNYKMIGRSYKYRFQRLGEAIGHYSRMSDECGYIPQIFEIENHFNPPPEIQQRMVSFGNSGNSHGDISISIECKRNDFLMHSTNFNMFRQVQTTEISSEGFNINWDRIVFNDYEKNKTIIRVITGGVNGSDVGNEIGLIPIDKWPLNDKIKLREKIDKLLVLI